MNTSRLFLLSTRTATHVGSGRGAGDIDLPIAREQSSKLPVIYGSALKGVMRDDARAWPDVGKDEQKIIALFGPERESGANDSSGMLAIQDARLLAMPVALLEGGWVWVTSPLLLFRYAREARHVLSPEKHKLPLVPECLGEKVLVASGAGREANAGPPSILVIGDQVLEASPSGQQAAKDWVEYLGRLLFPDPRDDNWRRYFESHLAIVSDEVMGYFSEFATEVQPRVKLDENRVAADTALWREESLPAETILFGIISAQQVEKTKIIFPNASAALNAVPASMTLQVGGKASVGKGLVDVRVIGGVSQ